jgi:CHASE2 domain-containing sensor protein
VLLTLVSAVEGWLWRIDQTLYDGVLSAWTQPASDDVVIVSIDDASLASIGRWPWSRRVHLPSSTSPGRPVPGRSSST